jgi:uncharacterized membrane protein
MAVGSYIISFLNDKYADLLSKEEQIVANLTLWMGTAWWFFGGITELERYRSSWTGGSDPAIVTSVIPKAYLLNIEIGYFSLMTFIFYFVAQKYSWDKFKSFAYGLIPVLFISFLMKLDEKINPFAYGGYAAWALAFAVIYYILYFNDQISKLSAKWNLKLAHVGALVTLVGVFVSEIKWWAELYVPESTAWQKASMGIVPVFAIWSITQNKMVPNWPVKRNYSLYLNFVLLPIVVSTWIWISITNWTNGGSSAPLPYLPLLNPLELSHLAALFAGTIWVMEVMKSGTLLKSIDKKRIGVVLGVTYFFWLNGVLCRAIHQYLGIPFDFSTMFSAVEVQVGLSIFWSVLGIAIMIFASKKLLRWLWITGASLLGLVVVKMFIIDLSKTETIGRVASFIIVGILFLIVGYFSPIPPRKTNNV